MNLGRTLFLRPGRTTRAAVTATATSRAAVASAALLLLSSFSSRISAQVPQDASPRVPVDALAWAYAIDTGPAPVPVTDDGTAYTLPGSAASFELDEIRDRFGPADWYAADHPAMPRIVAVGRKEAGIWACALCHYPNGKGRPENAGLAGLPKDYFVRQLHDFRDGLRTSADVRKANTGLMIGFARAMTEEEIEQAAEYFSSMPWTPWIEVVETDMAPKTRIQGGMHLRLEGANAGTEPIGTRVVESPRDTERTERLRDPRSGFVAYAPRGAVERGAMLAQTGGDRTVRCGVCHGERLDGLALVPPLRGRSPSYIARQLYDFQQGTRHGVWAPLMSAVVADLTAEDMVDLAAYIASLPPAP
jgi:cytochrome c553